ncbi:hypothetical protein J4477_01675 [Candidatus Pacearchaeota archaeon]|nr:hypothetical protein [Candidatus Pacearchaeota archaeon]
MVDNHTKTRKIIHENATDLINAGLADDVSYAQFLVKRLEERGFTHRIFYKPGDVIVRGAIEKVFDRVSSSKPYQQSNLYTGLVLPGRIGRLNDKAYDIKLALGEITRFTSKDKKYTHLVARVECPYLESNGLEKDGFFLSSHSAEDVRAKGKKTVDELENLERIEFNPFFGNYVIGMYVAWGTTPETKHVPLILHCNSELDSYLDIN